MTKTWTAMLLLAVMLELAGCARCEDGETRCDGAAGQICSDGDWETQQDCGAQGGRCDTDLGCGFLGVLGSAAGGHTLCCH